MLVGVALALWMGFGRFLFGVGGGLTWWYAPLIALPFAVLQIATVLRVRVAEDRGRPVGRATYVTLVLSWVSALGFGYTVPDSVPGAAGGELVSIMSLHAGEQWLGMSIALCNPFGIIAFALVIASLAFAAVAGRKPRPSEDELLDAAEAAGHAPSMVEHPLGQ